MKSEINLKDLPMGLGMALAQNTDAMKNLWIYQARTSRYY